MKSKKNEMTPMPDTQITDEMVEKALDAWLSSPPEDTLLSMRAALQAAISGYAIVPREPTVVQMDAAGSTIAEYVRKMKAAGGGVDAMDYALRVVIYRAMIQAAPPVPEMEGG